MKKLPIFLWLIILNSGYSILTPALAQEMTVIRVANNKLAGDKGSNDGVVVNQKYILYRETSQGLRAIGSAQVFVVKGSVFGFIFDIGFGYKFSNKVDARFEIPVFILTSSPEKASPVVPTFVFTLGMRFN